jgi:hypothetical protein
MIAAKTKEIEIPGPAYSAAACPVKTKSPAPMIAPIPIIVRLVAVNVLFKPWRVSDASCSKLLIDFLTNNPLAISSVECKIGDDRE